MAFETLDEAENIGYIIPTPVIHVRNALSFRVLYCHQTLLHPCFLAWALRSANSELCVCSTS